MSSPDNIESVTFVRLMTVAEVAYVLNVSERTVRLWVEQHREITPVKIGKFVRFRPEDVRAYRDAGAVGKSVGTTCSHAVPVSSTITTEKDRNVQ